MIRKALEVMEIPAVVWGFVSFIAVALDFFNVLPYYDIYYKRRTDITPVVSVYPGSTIRVNAEFATPIDSRDIESVEWTAKYSAGKEFADLPQINPLEVTLLPDVSGTLNLGVQARVRGDDSERYGTGSIYVAQTKPYRLVFLNGASFALSSGVEQVDLDTVQLYEGASGWRTPSEVSMSFGRLRLATENQTFPTWDGKAFLRYKPKDDQTTGYKYESPTALDATPKNPPPAP